MLSSDDDLERTKAWNHLYKTNYRVVYDLVTSNNGKKRDVKDVFHDALAILQHNIRSRKFKAKSSIQTYLYSISKNLWLKELANRGKEQTVVPEVIDGMPADIDGYMLDVEIITLLMSELKNDCRTLLTEYYFNNRSMEQLKTIFNVNSVQAAKNKKWRCLNYLKRLFLERSNIAISN